MENMPVQAARSQANAPLPTQEGDAAYQRLLQAAQQLVEHIHHREEEVHRLLRVTESINRGLGLEEVLEFLYEEFRPLIPFNRIGLALIEERHDLVVAHWAHSDRPMLLNKGFHASLEGSTLAEIVRTGRPRILNDLEAYLREKPESRSTALIVREGMCSSLTCPLIVRARPIGFLFFSSDRVGTYSNAHVEFFQQVAGQLSLSVEKGRLYSKLAEQAAVINRQNEQLLGQLELARQFQRGMIPPEDLQLPGIRLAFAYRPAQQVGGDLLDAIQLPGGRALAFVGDAMGHGVDAAMVMAATKTALLSAVPTTASLSELLLRINEQLHAMLSGERFVTAACAFLDVAGGRAEIAVAGHANPIHIRASDGELTRPGDGSIPLGVKRHIAIPIVSCPFTAGDRLLFYTDGIVEARNSAGQFFGEDRLLQLAREHGRSEPAELLAAIEDDLRGHCRGMTLNDDLTLLVVQAAS